MPRKINYTEKQIQDIIAKYSNKESIKNIAEQYGVSTDSIRRLLKKNNIQLKGNKKHFFNENIFDVIDTAEKAYWLGFITADGYIQYKNPKQAKFLRIKLQKCDKEHLYKFLDFIGGDENMISSEMHNTTGNIQYYIHVSSSHMVNTLKNMGIEQGKSANEKVVSIPDDFKKDYIRGLFDGDGHIREDNIDLVNSIEVLEFVQNYLFEKCDISKGKICDHCNTHRLYVCKNREKVLIHLYYEGCICLDRKRDIITEKYKNNYKFVAMSKSGKIGEG